MPLRGVSVAGGAVLALDQRAHDGDVGTPSERKRGGAWDAGGSASIEVERSQAAGSSPAILVTDALCFAKDDKGGTGMAEDVVAYWRGREEEYKTIAGTCVTDAGREAWLAVAQNCARQAYMIEHVPGWAVRSAVMEPLAVANDL